MAGGCAQVWPPCEHHGKTQGATGGAPLLEFKLMGVDRL